MSVTDRDRQAALNAYKGFLAGIRGEDDAQSLVAAFAAHRLATIEQCAKVADEDSGRTDKGHSGFGPSIAKRIAKAIRALTEGGDNEPE